MNICPQKCIQMEYDDEGFEYPLVDENTCTKCGRCLAICPGRQPKRQCEGKSEGQLVSADHGMTIYAAKNKDDSIREKSSSGGSFFLLAKSVIDKGGIVVGAGFDENHQVRHCMVETISDIFKIMGAKYAQSASGDIHTWVKQCLEQHRWVLFSGTPCQIAGLKLYLGQDYETLLSVDIICHGVPSPAVWSRYLDSLAIDREQIEHVYFRNKSTGWKNYSFLVKGSNGKELIEPHGNNLFMKGFLSDAYLRQSCYDCRYKGDASRADITLGDFWGIDGIDPEFDDDGGVSLVIARSTKGRTFLQEISINLDMHSVSVKDAFRWNPSFWNSSDKLSNRNRFFHNWNAIQMDELINGIAEKKVFNNRMRGIDSMRYIVFGIADEVRLKYSNEFIEKVNGFVDNDIHKQGKTYCGKPIYNPDWLLEEPSFIIVSSINGYFGIKAQLESMGFLENDDFVWGPNWYGNEHIPSTYGYKQWKDYDNMIDFSFGRWDYRVQTVASCIGTDIKSVMDLGAGAMSLKKYLDSTVAYFPVDYCKRQENTIVCDFERREFPDKKADCIVASGILEYISDLDWFVEQICNHCEKAVISYISIEMMRDFSIRQHEGWRNNYSLVQLIRLFLKHQFVPASEKMCIGNDLILEFERIS